MSGVGDSSDGRSVSSALSGNRLGLSGTGVGGGSSRSGGLHLPMSLD